MAYDPTVWVNGDIITANALNNIEGGIARSLNAIIIDIVDDDDTGLLSFVDGDGETYLYDGLLSLFDDYSPVIARFNTGDVVGNVFAEVLYDSSEERIFSKFSFVTVSESYGYIITVAIELYESGYGSNVNNYKFSVTLDEPEPGPL